jgi:hypothetical protein
MEHPMHNTLLTLTADNGIPFTMRVVRTGDRYGKDMQTTNGGSPMVEFYDARYPFDTDPDGRVLGQFVTRYNYTGMGARADQPTGLNLDGGVPDWTLDRETFSTFMRVAQNFLSR